MKNEYDIIVVGAGPAGTTAARFAAEQGVSVLVLEKDRDVGYPVRCAEAINKRTADEFIKPNDKWISSHISKFSFISPNNSEVLIDFNSVQGYILERKIFDYELAKIASNAGAEIITKAYVNGLLLEGQKVSGVTAEYRGQQINIKSKIVIGADGTESRVGRWAGIKTHVHLKNMESCFQVTASNISVEPDTLYFYFGKNVSPGGYFWVFPKSCTTANIGLGISGLEGKEKSALAYLNDNLARLFPHASILTQVAGGVPCSITLEKITSNGIMLLGDAARQVNPLSGGGIASGMIGGRIAGIIAAEAIRKNKLDHIFTYEKAWYNERGKMHEVFNRLKEGIYSFTDEDFNKIMEKFQKVPLSKRTIGKLFRIALANKPSLLIDISKVFLV
ncbi:MAG: NAD(P)/FAD-dependent oxidoreductase [Ignavibacteriaceae bacterium]|nr:NAD(P)/FAD-dependent oxidoreductase [Ignavibacteriaceae bacterium]